MRITILFGGTNKERLVSVASAQALHSALPDADLWFWDVDDSVHETSSEVLLAHSRPFEDPFKPGTPSLGGIERALDQAQVEERLLVLGLHGGMAENGELQAMCEMRGVPFTGSGSASSYLAFDKVAAKRFAAIAGLKVPIGVALDDIEAAFAEHGRLIAKPSRDGSSYGLIFVNSSQDIAAVRGAAKTEDYLIEPLISGAEATCGVLEKPDGSVIALPPIEIVPADGGFGFDYRAKYLAKTTQEICPGRFTREISAQIMEQSLKVHHALSCRGYSRTDFIISKTGPIYLETNTLPGLTKASLYPKALTVEGIEFADFLQGQIALAARHRS
ncbi:MAG: D-alanine--D-alanine ligase [Bradyrhizobium sp.]|uniref:D-alanine--D-alanine ligase family protein n=1 Tax=Bradyrhizobium sp. TaxID=376 RepID=UPI001C29C86B|nr:D-alanine--D-alanine ligase [Bradyrhizobium sp.]MBU6462079.1 D-alanine--D-alanine ligase [Pseudomonadota bacterium]MDE2066424.1 D-alanine--D-alanine ligase [Bradyrhizobium sp.]MDE2243457.1 D-alanine--D-alanine ligase [Bradyrhizobium sp.]MDE2468920.1 D-alanine--D-alanine ligase [Bradyrhizobium sp.]